MGKRVIIPNAHVEDKLEESWKAWGAGRGPSKPKAMKTCPTILCHLEEGAKPARCSCTQVYSHGIPRLPEMVSSALTLTGQKVKQPREC